MKVIKQIDENTRLVQAGKVPDVRIELQRKKWYGWKTINRIGTYRCDTIEQFETALLIDEQARKGPHYGRIVNPEKF